MGRASMSYENKANPNDPFEIASNTVPIFTSVSSQALTMPASNMFSFHTQRRWRTRGSTAEFFVLDLSTVRSVDLVALFGLTMSTAGTIRVRLLDSGSVTIYDTGVQTIATLSGGTIAYNSYIALMPSVFGTQFIRVDLTDSGKSYIEVGHIYAGRQNILNPNFSYGWQSTFTDRSIRSRTRGGQTQVWLDNFYRSIDLTFNFITATDRNDFVNYIDRVIGMSSNIFFITDVESTVLPRDSILGLISEETPVTQPYFDRYSKRYKIEERL